MECREVRELYSPWLDGELSSSEAQAMREHLDECAACRAELALWEKLSLSLKDIKEEVPAPQGFSAGVMARIQELETPVVKRRRWWPDLTWKQWVAGVAAAALLALGSATAKLPVKLPIWNGPVQVAEHKTPSDQVDKGAAVHSPVIKPDNSSGDRVATSPDDTQPTPSTQPDTAIKPNSTVSPRVFSQPDNETRVFLNKERRISSTLLKVQVGDVEQARTKALAIANNIGTSTQQVAQQSVGDKQCAILRLVMTPDKADGCLNTLAGLGTVLDTQKETRDITQQFATTLEQYRELSARRASTRDTEQKAQLDREIKDLENLLTTWDEEAQQYIVVLWLEEQ